MIEAKVVDIIDNRTLVLNKGTRGGVHVGMVFQIFEQTGKEVVDPDTKEVLGKIKLPKIKVKVQYVQERLAIAETYEFEQINVGGINTFSNVSNLFTPPKYVKKYRTFEIEDEQKAKIEIERSLVKVGDLAESINT